MTDPGEISLFPPDTNKAKVFLNFDAPLGIESITTNSCTPTPCQGFQNTDYYQLFVAIKNKFSSSSNCNCTPCTGFKNTDLYQVYCAIMGITAGGGTITGSGTTNRIPKFTSSTAIGNSLLFDNGTNAGVNTTTPVSKWEVSANDVSANIYSTRYQTLSSGSAGFIGRKANGSAASPTAILSGDQIAGLGSSGYELLGGFSTICGSAIFSAAENFTTTHHGTKFAIGLCANGSTIKTDHFFITDQGNVGIGVASPQAKLHVAGGDLQVGTSGDDRDLIFGGTNSSIIWGNPASGASIDYNTGSLLLSSVGHANLMNVLTSGFIGIGTTSDFLSVGSTLKLAVNGEIALPANMAVYFGDNHTFIDGSPNYISGDPNTLLVYNNVGSQVFYLNGNTNNANYYFKSTMSGQGTNLTRVFIGNDGKVGIATETPDASSIVDVTSTTQGFLPPRMTTTQKNAIASPAEGLVVYDTTLHQLCYYNGTLWICN